MTQILDSAFRGLMVGNQQFDRNRMLGAQERAAGLMTRGDRTGAARELMGAGQFGEAATLSNVSMTNAAQDARERAGAAAADGNYGAASKERFMSGDLEGGQAYQTEARNREAGSVLMDDPKRAAAITAAGGDVERATQIVDWADRIDERERQEVLGRHQVMAPVLATIKGLPYEQRRQAIAASAQALSGAGFTPEQAAAFDPTDENIAALERSQLGLAALMGSYSQRVVGDEVRTYRTDPYGVQRVGSEAVPYSRDEGRDDRRLELEEERLGIQREQLDVANSTGDVVGPLLQRYSRGEPLNEQEDSIVQHYLRSQQGVGMFGMPGAPQFAPPPQQAPLVGPNGSAPANRSGISPNGGRGAPQQNGNGQSAASPAAVQTADDFERLPVGAWFINPADGQIMQKAR